MADDKKVTITITSKFDKKGTDEGKKALKETEKQAEKTNKNMESSALSVSRAFTGIASGIQVVKAAWGAVKGVVGWFMESIEMANKNARSVNMLAAAYKNVGYNAAGAMDEAKKFASEMQNLTGIADEAFLDGQRLLANYGVVGAKAQEAIRAAYALSISQGMSLETSLMQIAKAAAGSTGSLSRFGIVIGDNVKDGEKFDAVLAQINDKFGANAQAAMGDTATQIGALKERWGDLREEIGSYLIPALQEAISWGNKAIDVLNRVFNKDRTVDQIAYEKNLEKIAEIQKKINEQEAKRGKKIYNQELVEKLINDYQKELKFYQQAQEALEKDNYERAVAAKKEQEIRDKQAEQINNETKLAAAKQNTAKETEKKADAEKKAAEEAARYNEAIRRNAGVGAKDKLSGWETENAKNHKLDAENVSTVDMFSGTNSQFSDSTDYDYLQKELEEQYLLKKEYLDKELTDKTEHEEALKLLNEQKSNEEQKLEQQRGKQRQKIAGEVFNNLIALSNSSNKKLATIGKAAGIAQATMSTYQGAANALANVPYPFNFVAAASVIAAGLANVAQIANVQLAEGGLVKAVTGGVPAVIGEGGSDEAVLPLDNARAMRRIGGAIADESGGLGGGTTINVNINASGGLVPFLDELTEATQNGVTEALRYANVAVKAGNAQGGLSV